MGQLQNGSGWIRPQIRLLQPNSTLMAILAAFTTEYQLSVLVAQIKSNYPIMATTEEIENCLLNIKAEINRLGIVNRRIYHLGGNRSRRDYLTYIRAQADSADS